MSKRFVAAEDWNGRPETMAQITPDTEENAVDVLHLTGEAKAHEAVRFGCDAVRIQVRTAKRGVSFWMHRDEALKLADEIRKEVGRV